MLQTARRFGLRGEVCHSDCICAGASSIQKLGCRQLSTAIATDVSEVQNKVEIMKIETQFTFFLALAVLALATSDAVAQQPFPDDNNQDEPIIVRPNQDRLPPRPFSVPGDEEETPDQSVLLNTRFAGWQQASVAGSSRRVSNELRANWLMVDRNGRFEGRVTAGEGADVTLMSVYLLNMGRLVKETVLNDDGTFSFNNVRQGCYALVGWGEKGFFAYGLNILDFNPETAPAMPPALEVIAFQNQTSINIDWIRFFAPQVIYRVYGRYPQGEGPDDDAALFGLEGLVSYAPKVPAATSISARPVRLTSDGRMVGRVHQMTSLTGRPVDVRTTRVMLFQGDDVVKSTETDNYGVFEFQGVSSGQYGLVAVGVDGMGMVGITVGSGEQDETMNALGELVEGDGAADGEVFDFCMVPSETVGWLNHTAIELAYLRNLLSNRRSTNDDQRTCPGCNGMGCSNCQGTGLCTSRSQSFESWANNCCNQTEKTKWGSGYILNGFSKDLRRSMERSNRRLENAFYGDGSGGGYTNQGYGEGGVPNLNGYGTGYDNGYGNYGTGYGIDDIGSGANYFNNPGAGYGY
jgi:hypothetical protein